MIARGPFQAQHCFDSVRINEKRKTERNEQHITLTANMEGPTWSREKVRKKEWQRCSVLIVTPHSPSPSACLVIRWVAELGMME